MFTEIEKNHFKLCEKLHNNLKNIPESVKDEIWDLLYNYYDPSK